MYLGLSGARIQGADAVHAGFATHFVPRAELAVLSRALAEDGPGALGSYTAPLPEFSLAAQRASIDECFGTDGVSAIVGRLGGVGDEWAARTLGMLRAVTPSALRWTLAALRRGEI